MPFSAEESLKFKRITDIARQAGAYNARVTLVESIPFKREFRKACEVNTCGNYGKCWMCPPYVGDIDELIAKAKEYKYAMVYQTVSQLEDSFDIEGMLAAGKHQNEVSCKMQDRLAGCFSGKTLHLASGGCRICDVCAKREDKPCRHPERALASLEAYGIAVSELAELSGMKYINGKNTVTFFGAYLFDALSPN